MTDGPYNPAQLTLAELADAAIRLVLPDPPAPSDSGPNALAGGWWPQTRELGLEIPPLVEALATRGIRVTRVTYHPSLWLIAPPKVRVDGRVVRLVWFREIDPNLVRLRTSDDRQLDLLVVPPTTGAAVAARALAAVAGSDPHGSPAEVLAAAETEGAILRP